MIQYPIETGCIVHSLAGRDAGRAFMVIRELDQTYVLIADGGLRTIDRPKKKKRRHLKPTGHMDAEMREKLMNGVTVTNAEIRRSLLSEEA